MIRVLHIFYEMGNGGVEHFVMDFYRKIDRNKIQFDFLTSVEYSGYFDDEIKKMGGRIFRAYPLKRNPIRNYMDIVKIIKNNHYEIVHRHTGSAFGYYELNAARMGGAKHLILHSHNPKAGNVLIHRFFKCFKIPCIQLACSTIAGEFLFGKKSDFKVIKNAIDCDKYRYNPNIRKNVRKELNIEDSFVIGHIGRFENQKNHKMLLEIFNEILKIRSNSKLICIGEGSLLEERKRQAVEMGIYDKILFLGSRDDVEQIIQAFDVFVFPSLYEGFSITLIEAQTNGLKCITSKELIAESSNITGNVKFVSLEKSLDFWAKTILDTDCSRDLNAINIIKKDGYDIKNSARELEKFYENLI